MVFIPKSTFWSLLKQGTLEAQVLVARAPLGIRAEQGMQAVQRQQHSVLQDVRTNMLGACRTTMLRHFHPDDNLSMPPKALPEMFAESGGQKLDAEVATANLFTWPGKYELTSAQSSVAPGRRLLQRPARWRSLLQWGELSS